MIEKRLNVVLIEDKIIPGDKLANLEQLERNLDKIPDNTDLVVLPELFSTGFFIEETGDDMSVLAERNTEHTIQTLKKIAIKHNIALVGSFMANTANKIYNRAFFIESNGDETYYDKRHIFGIGGENKVFTAGNAEPRVIRYRGWNILMAVCYDLRFPVWLRNVDNKYDLLVVVANWPKAREYAWEHLLIARAIENECYVCGCNCLGESISGTVYSGDSLIIDFRGSVIAKRENDSPIISACLNGNKLSGFRDKFPAWKDIDKFEIKR